MTTKRNNNIEDILNSLDGTPRAAAPDFFYTRLKARMEKELVSPQPARGWKLKPAYVVTALILALSVNAAVLLKGNATSADNAVVAIDETDQSIAAEYNLYENNIVYDLNQDK